MKYLQKLGKALMLPVACLPICGILMGIGYALCPATMQGGVISGVFPTIGFFMVQAGGALINNMALLFVIGVGVGMADDHDGTAALSALTSWLMITTLLSVDSVSTLFMNLSENQILAFDKVANPFIGILSGIIGSTCYNRFRSTKLPDWLSFFSGKRCVAIISGIVSIVVSAILLFVWPVLFGGLVSLGKAIVGLDAVGAGIYVFLNRLLIPTGLQHALNNVFWFDTIGLGDLSHFWAGETSADVSWSLGMYMSGFFPCMMFGVPGAALAMIRTAKPGKKKVAIGLVGSAALCAFVCGVTEPFEFGFMFLAPVLYVIYALLYGIFTIITVYTGFRAGFSFSAGATDLLFSASLPAAQKTWMILPLGAAAFVVFYLVFVFMIRKMDLKTPGREEDEERNENGAIDITDEKVVDTIDTADTKSKADARNKADVRSKAGTVHKNGVDQRRENDYTKTAAVILAGLGGKDNIASLDNCITRLRIEVRDDSLIDEKKIKSTGISGIMRPGKNSIQIIVGTKVQFLADEIKKMM